MKTRRLFSFCFVIITLSLIACSSEKNKTENDLIVGAKLYEHQEDFNLLFDQFNKVGINTVFASTELISNKEFMSASKNNGIKTFVILPIFYAPEALDNNPDLYAINQFGAQAKKEWVKFVCPSNQEFIDDKVKFIRDFVNQNRPDGISLDFIRHFAFWEKIYADTAVDSIENTCFDKNCLSKFSKDENIIFPIELDSTLKIYSWLKNNHHKEWVIWKNKLISSTVERIVTTVKADHPEIIINLHAVPWKKDDFDGGINSIIGQDFRTISNYVDYISPMTYSHMLKREPNWIHSVVDDINKYVDETKILPSIQVEKAYLSESISPKEFEACLRAAIEKPSAGVVFWNWDMLVASKEKLEITKNILTAE